MSQFLVLRRLTLSLATLSAAALLMAAQNVEPSSEAARLEGFSGPDGTNYFALSLRATPALAAGAPSATTPRVVHGSGVVHGPREVVVLFSSAASQTAGYRQKALAALAATLAGLDPGDRVKIMAYDLRAVPITAGFVAPNGPEAARAMAALRARVPLGAADLEGALMTAAGSYYGNAKAARAIVLVGEGASRANAMRPEQFQELILRLVAERIPVLSYGIGPRIDPAMLRALAGRTGGMAVEDDSSLSPDTVGGMLASAAHAPVYWPTGQATWSAGTEVYPKTLPPLRSDRDTVLVGTIHATAAARLELCVEGPRGPQTLAWNLPALRSDGGNGFLRPVVEQARIDGGVSLPLVDTASLRQAREELLLGGRNLDQLARTALAANNLDGAEKLITEALRRDPSDPQAAVLSAALAKRRAAPAAAGAPSGSADNLPPAGALVENERQRISVAEQATQMEVTTVVNRARALMGIDPAKALANLRDETEKVRQSPEIRPELRDQLLGHLRAALRAAKARQTEFENRMRVTQEAEAAAKERMLTDLSGQRDRRKVQQLMERFDYLVREAKYKEAEEDTAGEAAKIVDSRMDRSNNPQVAGAILYARTRGAVENSLVVRVAAQKGYLDTMLQNEKSHVPTADVPAIVYPQSDVWTELSARRVARYGAADLSRREPGEKKIDEALKSPTAIEFVETPLRDVIDYLRDLHKVEIQLDMRELEGMGINGDTPVTVNLKGISLRSALKLLLDNLGLKFVVHDEVLLVTSKAKAEEEFLTTKVYPVADLAIPIRTPAFAGGFGGLGGFGPFGGQGNSSPRNGNNMNPFGNPGNGPLGGPGMNPFGGPGPGQGNIPGIGQW